LGMNKHQQVVLAVGSVKTLTSGQLRGTRARMATRIGNEGGPRGTPKATWVPQDLPEV
jgi:hypothetical protein